MVCVETRHMKAVLKAQQVSKSDRNDARGIAQMMRVGSYKAVHVKTARRALWICRCAWTTLPRHPQLP